MDSNFGATFMLKLCVELVIEYRFKIISFSNYNFRLDNYSSQTLEGIKVTFLLVLSSFFKLLNELNS